MDELSAVQGADDPVFPCEEKNVRDIYPARFGFSPLHLQQFSFNDNPDIGRRRELDSFDFEVRQLRQGYIYLYIESGIYPENHRTDPANGNWMVFWYETNVTDDNASFLKSSVHDFNGCFREKTFTRLIWPDSDPTEKWELVSGSTYDTIKISDDIQRIEVAYSEEPWPAEWFKKCESDAGFRAELMMSVELAPELTTTSCAISLIENYVEEFKPDAANKAADYDIAHTGFCPTNKNKLGLTESQQFNGRVVVVPDPVGELLELERQTINVNATLMKHNADYLYPLTTGECIESVNSAIFSTRNKLQNKILFFDMPTQYDKIRRQLLQENDELSTNLRRLVKNHSALLQLDTPYEALTQLRLMLEGITRVEKKSALKRLVLASRLFVRCFMNINDTNEGSQALVTLLDPGNGYTLGTLFRNLMLTWGSVSEGLLDSHLEALNAFDVVLEVTSKELGILGTAKIQSLGVSEAVNKLHPIQSLGRQPMSASDLSDLIKTGELPPLTSGGKVITDYKQFAKTRVYAGDVEVTPSIPEKDTVEVQHFMVDGQVRPGAHFKQVADSQRPQRGYGVGLSLFINAWTFFDLAKQKDEVGYAKTWFGRVSNDTRLNLGLGFVAIVSDLGKFTQFRLNYIEDLSANTLRQGGAKNLFSNIKGKLFNSQSVKAISTGKTGVAQSITSKVKTAGKVAGWAGVVLSFFGAREAFENKQFIKSGLLATQFLSGGIYLWAGASNPVGMVAGVILAVSMVAEFLFTRDKMTAWAEHGFWGTSDNYWGVDRPEDLDIQIEKALEINQAGSPVAQYYREEIQHFQRLVYQVRVKAVGQKSGKVELLLPRLSQGDFTLKTRVLIKYQTHKVPELEYFSGRVDKSVIYLHGFEVHTQPAENKVSIDLNQQLREHAPEKPGYIQYIYLHYEYTDPAGHFTSGEVEIYNDKHPHSKEVLPGRWWYRLPRSV